MSAVSIEGTPSGDSFHSAGEFVDARDSIAVEDAFHALSEWGSLPESRGSFGSLRAESEAKADHLRRFWRLVKDQRAKRSTNFGLLLRKRRKQHRSRQTVSTESSSLRDRSAAANRIASPEEDQDLRDGLDTPTPDVSSDEDRSSVSFDVEQSKHRGSGLFDAAKNHLFYTIERRRETTKPKISVLNLSTLQRIILHCIQNDLAEEGRQRGLQGRNTQEYRQ
ncbi:hypothetical protein KC356_g9266 [Hortaea werneckii]|nr:hypothetical protein KC356_g9266 [Hortaea werneckii]